MATNRPALPAMTFRGRASDLSKVLANLRKAGEGQEQRDAAGVAAELLGCDPAALYAAVVAERFGSGGAR